MTTSAASLSGAAGRYASAIFELADAAGSLDSVAQELGALAGLIGDNDDLGHVVTSPAFSREEQGNVMTSLQEKLGQSELTRNFVGLMAQKGRLGALPAAIQGFDALLADRRGQDTAYVTTASKLSDAQMDALAKNLKTSLGKEVTIRETVDESLIGGLVVKVGSKMVDASLRSKLERLELAMKEN